MIKYEDNNKRKFEMRSEDNSCIQIIKWNLDKNPRGPVSIETQWKSWIVDEWENKDKFSKQK